MLSREELRVLMLPWVGVLRDYVDLGEWHATWDAHGGRVVWVQMVSSAPRGIEPRAFDAMELLTLLGEIDFAAWRIALAAAWPRHAGMWIEAANGRALRFGWKLVFHSSNENAASAIDIDKWCDRIVVDGAARARSREYLRARTVLENEYKQLEATNDRGIRRPLAREHLQIPIQLRLKDGSLETRLLKVLQVAALQRARELSPVNVFQDDPWRPLMRITDVDVGEVPLQASPKAFLNAAQLATFDIQLNQLTLDRVNVTMDTAMLYTAGLQHLLGIRRTGSDHQTGRGVANVVQIPATQRQTTAAIFSALAHSPCIRSVAVNKTPLVAGATSEEDVTKISSEDRDHMWQWAAVSLFSSHASNTVQQVEIDVGDLCMKDVVAMETVLRSRSPFWDLCVDVSHSGTSLTEVTEYVTTSKFRLLSPQKEAPRGVEPTMSLASQCVAVVQNEMDGWLRVLLPGWGTAWVHDDSIEERSSRVIGPSTIRAIPSLKLSNVTGACTAPVVSLLRTVGRNLRSLEVSGITVAQPLDQWMQEVLRACPRLEDLKVTSGGSILTLDTILDGYDRGYCRLRSLSLLETSVGEADSVLQFLYAMAIPSNHISQCLRRLTLSYAARTPLTGLSKGLQDMLESNSTVEQLTVTIRCLSSVPTDQLIQRRQFAKFETPIAVRLLPLSLGKKVAFLSVIHAARGQGTDQDDVAASVVQLFDSRILSLIFQFAAQCRNRTIDVRLTNSRSS